VKVSAEGPYTTRVQWSVDPSTVTGVEVEVRRNPDLGFVRAAVADGHLSAVVLNLRMAKTSYEYRVSAWNALGRSEGVTAKVTMPCGGVHPENA